MAISLPSSILLLVPQIKISANRACLQDLHATNPRHDKSRIEMNKGGLLKDAYNWILHHADFQQWRYQHQSQLLWIKGDPGKGKTMLLCGIINELDALETSIVSFFFCQTTDVRINHATAVLRGLIFMLVDQQPSLISHIRRPYDKAGKRVFTDANSWVALSEILINILEDPLLKTTFLIIDALDECTEGLDQLLELIAQKASAYPHVKWIVSSRNWQSIEEILDAADLKTNLCLELNETVVAEAVSVFIHYKVKDLAGKKNYDNETCQTVSQHLLSNAHGTFLWVALVCERLTKVLRRHVQKKLHEFPPGLNELYKRMLAQISDSDDAELCRSFLSVITTVYRPITLDELASCLELPQEILNDSDMVEVIGLCGSFLTIRERTIYLVHQSAKDFLLQSAVHEIFPAGQDMVHYSIFSKSLQVVAKMLRRDIYNLRSPGYPIDQVRPPEPDPLAQLRYACLYWVDHVDRCSPSLNAIEDLQDSGSVGAFFHNDYLHWLEALSLTRCLSGGIGSMLRLQSLLQTIAENSTLINRVKDACQFSLYHKTAIENHPLQVYVSGLIFSPTGSMSRIQFKSQEPTWMVGKPIMNEGWSDCLQTLEGHEDSVRSVAFSHDSRLIASASEDRMVKVWDTSSSQCLRTLVGHDGSVHSVTFSHDSKFIASASKDRTVKVWDTTSSQCLWTLVGHDGSVHSVTFSHDSKFIASASEDRTVKMWDTISSQCLQTLAGHSGPVHSVTFSHDSKLIASASSDRTIKVWATNSNQCLKTLPAHSKPDESIFSHDSLVKFSHDSKLLASAQSDYTINVWDTSSGQCLQTLRTHKRSVDSVIFSHDSSLLASASNELLQGNGVIQIWHAESGRCLKTLKGHYHTVETVSFSHDSKHLASASDDNTVKVWDIGNTQDLEALECCEETLDGHNDFVHSVTFSHDSTLLASASADHTVKVWDTSSGKCRDTFEGHTGPVKSVTFSSDSKLLASNSDDCTKVWDTSSGQCLRTFEAGGHTAGADSVAFSHDSKLLASASSSLHLDDLTIIVWDTYNGQCLQTLCHVQSAGLASTPITFSHDSKLIAFPVDLDSNIKVYSTSSGQCLNTFKSGRDSVHSLIFSHDSTLLASSSEGRIVKLWDTSSGNCLWTLHSETVVTFRSFDSANSSLETDGGTVDLTSVLNAGLTDTHPEFPRFEGYYVNFEHTCITWNSENILRLPQEYRSSAFAKSLSTVCLGCTAGRVLFLTFDTPRLQHVLGRH